MSDSYEYDVFLSHSSKDKYRVRPLAFALEKAGFRVWFDEWRIPYGAVFEEALDKALSASEKVMVCLTPQAMASEWARVELAAVRVRHPMNRSGRLLLLMLEETDLEPHPTLQIYKNFDFKNPTQSRLNELLQVLRGAGPGPNFQTHPPKLYLGHLPHTGEKLFGRDDELRQLEVAWQTPAVNVATLVAGGGVGKSALTNHWLTQLQNQNYLGAKRVYGWSFYSQGSDATRQASSDVFINEALQWFGDAARPGESAWEKGKRLARLIRNEKTLLILDGLEPLQYGDSINQGRLKDQGMQSLLRELAHGMDGLCLISTREAIWDLAPLEGGPVLRIDLEQLTPEAGAALLSSYLRNPPADEVRAAVESLEGHALALTLLGHYLQEMHNGAIAPWRQLPALTVEAARGGHARRVLAAFNEGLLPAQRQVLLLLGLFDRPAEFEPIQAVLAPPIIPGLTDQLGAINSKQWQTALRTLRDYSLLARAQRDHDALDAHPLIREHFADHLKLHHPEAWQEAHSRLYEYFKKAPAKELPDTLEEMEPLFRAVTHGCLAGKPQETLEEVYWPRISRTTEFYSTNKLGAYGSDLAAVAAFFTRPWREPAARLSEDDKAVVLNWAAFRLRGQGRLREAGEPFEAGEKLRVQQEMWKGAAANASNSSELLLTLGEVNRAVEAGARSVRYADDSGDVNWRYASRTTHADALHQAGELEQAEGLFQQAEAMQREYQPQVPYLFSLWGYRYCDLLLTLGRPEEVLQRAAQSLEWVRKAQLDQLSSALDQLSLGRAHLHQALAEGAAPPAEAQSWLNGAVDGLRKSGAQDFIPRGLIARAGLWRVMKAWPKARDDLDEATEIAQRGEMALFYVDIALEEARLAKALEDSAAFERHKAEAAKWIETTGYKRRLKDLAEL